MNSIQDKLDTIIKRFISKKIAQVEGYNRFGYVRLAEKSIIVSREAGLDTKIPREKIKIGIEAVRKNNSVYYEGPSSLRKYGITHITSPIWALIHLLTLEEINQ